MAHTHTIGVRELKARLSACLRRVQAGERLTVTDRGRAIATIVPAGTADRHAWVHRMVAEGRVSWGGGKPTGLPVPIKLRGKPASEMVLEDRR
jgi:prevent-host-death family protein